ncbi:phage terminase small subunit [uncultured Sphingomonas sp.]|uniref:phage terminase small subunit n=1 Tax=uncultured Sphingomonas sp. TaxID=158754 RepID=UPI0025ECC45D|nr:phage terminase small subunit [uncultured Sphingomonas sp.]
MSLARRNQERILAMKAASAPASGSGFAPTAATGTAPVAADQVRPNTAAAAIKLRLTHALRRLAQIKAVTLKVAAKREMLPEYRDWCDGVLAAGRASPPGSLSPTGADEVLPTVMVWSIDIEDYSRALELAAHVLRHEVTMPSRYQRDAATLVLEEIAEAALRAQAINAPFPLSVLEQVEELTAGIDMHDEPRAKLAKAIGVELARAGSDAEADAARPIITRAIAQLEAAQRLNDRVGVKTKLTGLRRALASLPAPDQDNAGPPG